MNYMCSAEVPVSEARMRLLQCLEVKRYLMPRCLEVVEEADRDFVGFTAILEPALSMQPPTWLPYHHDKRKHVICLERMPSN